MLEHHSHMTAHFVDIDLRGIYLLSVKPDFSAGGRLQQIQAAQEGTFPGTGRPDNHTLLPRMNMVVYTLQYLIVFKLLI